ncbi:MAG: type II toxin-antitoxin system HicA family toxin [Chloroflexi bacterium]|nr:type II toxin-antitoxin system HicA family toxin [Chloroflexota bacterium]
MSQERLPSLKPYEVVRVLERVGFARRRQTGSHAVLVKSGLRRPVTVPMHTDDLPPGTLRAIIRQAGLSREEFVRLLRA